MTPEQSQAAAEKWEKLKAASHPKPIQASQPPTAADSPLTGVQNPTPTISEPPRLPSSPELPRITPEPLPALPAGDPPEPLRTPPALNAVPFWANTSLPIPSPLPELPEVTLRSIPRPDPPAIPTVSPAAFPLSTLAQPRSDSAAVVALLEQLVAAQGQQSPGPRGPLPGPMQLTWVS